MWDRSPGQEPSFPTLGPCSEKDLLNTVRELRRQRDVRLPVLSSREERQGASAVGGASPGTAHPAKVILMADLASSCLPRPHRHGSPALGPSLTLPVAVTQLSGGETQHPPFPLHSQQQLQRALLRLAQWVRRPVQPGPCIHSESARTASLYRSAPEPAMRIYMGTGWPRPREGPAQVGVGWRSYGPAPGHRATAPSLSSEKDTTGSYQLGWAWPRSKPAPGTRRPWSWPKPGGWKQPPSNALAPSCSYFTGPAIPRSPG